MKATLLFFFVSIFKGFLLGQSWEYLTPFPGLGKDDAVAFSYEEKGYLITGNNGGYEESNLLFIYDSSFDNWSIGEAFPGIKRQYAGHFQIKDKFFIIGGYSEFGNALKDVWRFSISEQSWQQLNDFPGEARWSMVGFSIENNGYIGTGTTGPTMLNDFWQYNVHLDQWVKQADFPSARREAIGFSNLGKGIVGMGYSAITSDECYDDLYAFYPERNQWQIIASYPGGKRLYSEVAANHSIAVVGGGMNESLEFQNDAYQLLPEGNWERLSDLNLGPIRGMATFNIGNAFYFVGGLKEDNSRSNELVKIELADSFFPVSVYPNPSKDFFRIELPVGSELEIFNVMGQRILYETAIENGYFLLHRLTSGTYLARIKHQERLSYHTLIQL